MVDFAEIKAANPIEKVAELLGIEVTKQRNGQLRGCCPIHGGNDPRGFVITPAKGLWYCFKGCGGGDQLALVAKVKKLSPKEAAEWLVGGTSTGASSGTVPDREPVQESGSGFRELDYLQADHEAVEAVGFDPETAEALGIGFARRAFCAARWQSRSGCPMAPSRVISALPRPYCRTVGTLRPRRLSPLRPKKAS